jgi:hypothetical protein
MNKQQKYLQKNGLASCNGGASTVISAISHGSWAFQDPAQAVERKKSRGSRSWKISKRHPANPNSKSKY